MTCHTHLSMEVVLWSEIVVLGRQGGVVSSLSLQGKGCQLHGWQLMAVRLALWGGRSHRVEA